tara:strand:- start:225 stop:491 length:267 start_codon:yes stop_codon:yes gene_type:complete
MRGLKDNSILGSCLFCREKIIESSDLLISKHAKVTHGKWLCGRCLISMKDVVDEVHDDWQEEHAILDKRARKNGFAINIETGKLEVIS